MSALHSLLTLALFPLFSLALLLAQDRLGWVKHQEPRK